MIEPKPIIGYNKDKQELEVYTFPYTLDHKEDIFVYDQYQLLDTICQEVVCDWETPYDERIYVPTEYCYLGENTYVSIRDKETLDKLELTEEAIKLCDNLFD